MEKICVENILAEVQSAELYLSFFCDKNDDQDYNTSLDSFVGVWHQLKSRRGSESFIPQFST